MLSAAKYPCPHCVRNDIAGHAERSEASTFATTKSVVDSSLWLAMTVVGRVSDCGIKPPASLRERKAAETIQTRHAVPKMDVSLWLAMTLEELLEISNAASPT